jgi:CheY-like chemotaxis protein
MNIENKLKLNNVSRVLVVDDALENIVAAKRYFDKLGIEVDYAFSAEEAKQRIQESFISKEKYSLVITDLEMEEKNSGIEVGKCAYNHLIIPLIATGRNYDALDNAAHGPSTTVLPFDLTIKGRKNREEIWEKIFEGALDYLQR